MEKIVRISLKVILAILFLYNISFFSFISNLPKERPAPQKADYGKEDNQYLNEKASKAKNLGTNYGPEEYFADLTDIQLKKKNNEFDRSAVINVNFTTNLLMAEFHENVLSHRKLDSEKEYESFMARVSVAQQKSLNITDPEAQKRDAEFKTKVNGPSYWTDLLKSLLSWFLKFYWLNLPLGLILLWLWWYEDKNKLSISNPLSFLICLILYPLVIARVWILSIRNGARIFAMSVEFKRRQTDIFSLISNDELADIKRFAKSNLKVSDYRDYLKNRGLAYQHALVPVIMVTFILLFVPRTTSAEVKQQSVDLTKCQLCIKAPPDFQASNQHEKVAFAAILPLNHQLMFVMTVVWQLVLPPTSKRCQGFQTNPDPIPLVA